MYVLITCADFLKANSILNVRKNSCRSTCFSCMGDAAARNSAIVCNTKNKKPFFL